MMLPLIIEEKEEQTPKVILDPINNLFTLSGDVVLDESRDKIEPFFKPIFEWLNDYLQENNEIIFEFKIHFVNPVAWEQIEKLVHIIKLIPNHQVVWLTDSDDEDMQEAGEELLETTNANFKFRHFR